MHIVCIGLVLLGYFTSITIAADCTACEPFPSNAPIGVNASWTQVSDGKQIGDCLNKMLQCVGWTKKLPLNYTITFDNANVLVIESRATIIHFICTSDAHWQLYGHASDGYVTNAYCSNDVANTTETITSTTTVPITAAAVDIILSSSSSSPIIESTTMLLNETATTQDAMLIISSSTEQATTTIKIATIDNSTSASPIVEETSSSSTASMVLCAECDIHVLMKMNKTAPTITFNGCHHVLLMCPPLHQFIIVYDTAANQSMTLSESKAQGILTMFCMGDHNVWHDGSGHNVSELYCMSLKNSEEAPASTTASIVTDSLLSTSTETSSSSIITDSLSTTTAASSLPTGTTDASFRPSCYKCQYSAIRTFNPESHGDDYLMTVLSAKERMNDTACARIWMSCTNADDTQYVIIYSNGKKVNLPYTTPIDLYCDGVTFKWQTKMHSKDSYVSRIYCTKPTFVPKSDCCEVSQIDTSNPNAPIDNTTAEMTMMNHAPIWNDNICARMKMTCNSPHHIAITYDDGSKSFGKYYEPIYVSCNQTSKMWMSEYNRKIVSSFYCYDPAIKPVLNLNKGSKKDKGQRFGQAVAQILGGSAVQSPKLVATDGTCEYCQSGCAKLELDNVSIDQIKTTYLAYKSTLIPAAIENDCNPKDHFLQIPGTTTKSLGQIYKRGEFFAIEGCRAGHSTCLCVNSGVCFVNMQPNTRIELIPYCASTDDCRMYSFVSGGAFQRIGLVIGVPSARSFSHRQPSRQPHQARLQVGSFDPRVMPELPSTYIKVSSIRCRPAGQPCT